MQMQKSGESYPKRGEIYIADLKPSFGREIGKARPALIISDNALNKVLPTVIVIPFSSIVPQDIGPDFVKFSNQKGLKKTSVLVVNQLGAIDKIRLIEKIGRISKQRLSEIENALKLVLGFSVIET